MEPSWPSAQRLENPRHSPTLRQPEKAAALGERLMLALALALARGSGDPAPSLREACPTGR